MNIRNEGKLKRGIIAAILICAVLLSSCAGGGGEAEITDPVADTTVAETTAEETTVEETTVEDTTAEETTVEETTAEETTVEDTTAEETTVEETTAEETTVGDTTAEETTSVETTAPAIDTTVTETTVPAVDTTALAETGDKTENTLHGGSDGGSQGLGNPADPDYGGQEFTFLFFQQNAGGRDYYGGNYLNSDMLTGATIDDAVYKRNRAVEEKYNVQINQRIVSVNDEGEPVEILRNYNMAGDHSFDAIYGWGYKLGACIVEGLLGDFKTLPGVDLTQEYWSPSTIEDLSVNNKLYLSINDISMNKLEWSSLLFFNKKIVEDYNLEATNIGNFYNRVKDGTWTYDVYLNAIKAVSADLDGDGMLTKNDIYGLIDAGGDGVSLGQSCGVTLTQKREDGSYALNYYNTKSVDLAAKIQEVYSNNKYVKTYEELMQNADDIGNMDLWSYSRSFFAKDHALFCTGTAYNVNEFRTMTSGYGILPMPKYDANQKNYISMVDTNASIFAIPTVYRQDHSSGSPERTGAILEYMAYESNRTVLPAYLELTLKGIRFNSDDDRLMLDTIRTNIHYEFSQMMGITSIADSCREMFRNPASSGSQYRMSSMRLQKELDDFYKKVILKNK